MVPTLRLRSRWALYSLSALLVTLAFAAGCRSVSDISDPAASTVHTTIAGRVTNETGAGLAGVTITAGAQSATTNADGLFFITNVVSNSEHAFVIAKKAGYFNGARTARPIVNGTTYMQIGMVPEVLLGSVDATTGGTLTTTTGAKLKLDGGSVVTASGSAYTGTVSVYAAHLSPSDPAFAFRFPGDLSATGADGKPTILRSFGVMLAELRGASGETLEPASGKPAHLTVPVPSSLQSLATSTIPLWYFDEASGLWKEEGSATLNGTSFVGDVKHFTAWNCDYSGPWGEVHGRVTCGGEPMPGIVVSLGGMYAGGQPMVTTDQKGEFTAKVPADWSKLEYQIIAGNNQGFFYTNAPVKILVPANTTLELGDIPLDSPCPSYLVGAVRDCDGKLTAGMVIGKSSNGGLSYTYSQDGNYKLLVPANQTITLAATSAAGFVAQPITTNSGAMSTNVTAPDLIACQEAAESFIDLKGSFSYSDLVFSPDGSKFAVQKGTDVVIYAAPGWSEYSRISTGSINDSLRRPLFSKDGSKLLLSTNSVYEIEVWNVNGTKVTTTPMPIYSGVFSDDGNSVIGIDGRGTKSMIVNYDLQGNLLSSFPLTVPDGGLIVGKAADGSLVVPGSSATYLVDPTTGSIKSQFPTTLYYWGSKVSANGHIMGGWSNAMHFYELATGKELTPAGGLATKYNNYDIAPDDISFVQALSDGTLTTLGFFSIADGTPKHLLEVDQSSGFPNTVAISPDGKHVAALYTSGIRIWTLK